MHEKTLHPYIIAEGEKGELHKLEMLHAERNAYDGDAEYDAPCQMGEGNGYASYKPPNDVH